MPFGMAHFPSSGLPISSHSPMSMTTSNSSNNNTASGHPMLTLAKAGIVKPNPKYSSSEYAFAIEPIPRLVRINEP